MGYQPTHLLFGSFEGLFLDKAGPCEVASVDGNHDSNPNMFGFGMNFVTSDTDVFDTWLGLPSTSTQIN